MAISVEDRERRWPEGFGEAEGRAAGGPGELLPPGAASEPTLRRSRLSCVGSWGMLLWLRLCEGRLGGVGATGACGPPAGLPAGLQQHSFLRYLQTETSVA